MANARTERKPVVAKCHSMCFQAPWTLRPGRTPSSRAGDSANGSLGSTSFIPCHSFLGCTSLARPIWVSGRQEKPHPSPLFPLPLVRPPDANTERIILARPDRDIYRIGLGIDLIQLLTKGNGKPADTKAKPPADTKTSDAVAAAANPPAATKQKASPSPKSPPPAQGGAANQDKPANTPQQ
jgi:hypothetical protein